VTRLAQSDEVASVEACVRDAFSKYVDVLPLPPTALSADYGDLIARGAVHVAVDGEVLGAVTLLADGDDLMVTNLAVRPDTQGRGLGRRLMAHAEEVAAARGCRRVTLFTHELMVENIAFYGGLGYEETGRRITDGRSRVHFAKAITPS